MPVPKKTNECIYLILFLACVDCKLEKDFEHPKAYDFEMAKKLYDLSVQLTGLKVGK